MLNINTDKNNFSSNNMNSLVKNNFHCNDIVQVKHVSNLDRDISFDIYIEINFVIRFYTGSDKW